MPHSLEVLHYLSGVLQVYRGNMKVLVFAALVCTARAGIIGAPYGAYGHALAPAPLGYARPLAAAVKVAAPLDDYDPNPQYSYAYDIQDALTGDSKSQQESRSGDVVQGSYSLTEPDGTRRTVEYVADPANGFNAVVHKEPLVAKALAPAYGHGYAPVAKVAYPGLAHPGLYH